MIINTEPIVDLIISFMSNTDSYQVLLVGEKTAKIKAILELPFDFKTD